MNKQLAALLLVLSCITVALSELECLKAQAIKAGAKDPTETEKCLNATLVCEVEEVTTTLPGVGSDSFYNFGCAISPSENNQSGKCVPKGAAGTGTKNAYCTGNKCNTMAKFKELCGGQDGLKSSFIFGFGAIIMCLLLSRQSPSSWTK